MAASSHIIDVRFDAQGAGRQRRLGTGRRASGFARQALARLTRLGLIAQIVVRADSGFYAEKVVAACQAHGARFSISVRLQKSHHQLIAAIPEKDWKPIPTGWRAPPTWPRSPTGLSARSRPTG